MVVVVVAVAADKQMVAEREAEREPKERRK